MVRKVRFKKSNIVVVLNSSEGTTEEKEPEKKPIGSGKISPAVNDGWSPSAAGNQDRKNNYDLVNGNDHHGVLKQSGATLPRSQRRHTTHVSFDQVPSKNSSPNKSILKSPLKLPSGRIEVIREELEVQQLTPGNIAQFSSMHRSVEIPILPPPVPPPLQSSGLPAQFQERNSASFQRSSEPDRNYAIYSEPTNTLSIGNKLRLDYYNSQGSHFVLSEDDAGVMSEADTTSTGFRRGTRARASLPIVSKTLEKPLGLVFLQFREETKRAVLPNEITTIDTVKALFVRAFPRTLTMQSFEPTPSQQRKIYILDQRKDMFYELEDLRDVRDRAVLKVFESDNQTSAPQFARPLPLYTEPEMNYFSEPEFDTISESSHRFQSAYSSASKYSRPFGGTLPSKGISNGFLGQPVGFVPPVPPKPHSHRPSFSSIYGPMNEEPIYANTGERRPPSRSGAATPIIDEEARYRVDAMERHLANLTGLVQQALAGKNAGVRGSDFTASHNKPAVQKDGKPINDVNVTPSVSGPVLVNTNAESQPAENGPIFLRYPDPMLMEYLGSVQSRIKEMQDEAQALRRHASNQSLAMREIIKENFERLHSHFKTLSLPHKSKSPKESRNVSNEVEAFQRQVSKLAHELSSLESRTEEMKTEQTSGQLSLRDVEMGSSALNELSNQLSDMRLKLPDLQERIKIVTTNEMENLIRSEMFVKEEPAKLEELAAKCRKITSTLLSLNKSASVRQESLQLSENEVSVDLPPSQMDTIPHSSNPIPPPPARRESLTSTDSSRTDSRRIERKPQDMLDDLLSELEVFTDAESREGTPDRLSSTIKRSPKATSSKSNMTTSSSDGYKEMRSIGLSPPSMTPSNSSQSTATTASTMSSVTDSSFFSPESDSSTLSKVQVGVGDQKAVVTSRPSSRKPSDAEKSLTEWLCSITSPPPPPRSVSKSPVSSPGAIKTGAYFTLPGYPRTVSEPGDYQDANSADYANLRELRSPSIKDQRLTPQQQDKIGSYYTSKLRKGSDPGTFRSQFEGPREPPMLPPKPGNEDPSVAPPLPPRNRQQVLEERHQELLRKQRQLQEQYARLQQLQRDQKQRASSPGSRNGSPGSPGGSPASEGKRGTPPKSNSNELYATLPMKPVPVPHPMALTTNGSVGQQKIYETDIL